MKDTFVQLSEYIESLEQRIAALETRAAALESRALDADLSRKDAEDQLKNVMAQLAASAARIAALETQPVQPVLDTTPQTIEPEVENTEETPQVKESVQEEEPVKEETVPVEEPVQDEPKTEPIVTPKPEKPAAFAPQQTSLFGASVSDIRQAISLGDRFLFQRELFGGNGEALQKLLDRLNAAANWHEAIDIVSQQDWDKESSTYELFLNVLRRRFSDSM
ncbi:MAG: hypothetical protein IJ838_06500 [Paludibacteraceae bacterium]|nr:hypothetical protein [Paludibacteraceae bacterium]